MAWQVANLPALIPTSSGSLFTNGIGSLDDAESITIFMTSSSATGSSAAAIQVSQFDPAIAAPVGVTQSTGWYLLTIGSTTGGTYVFGSTLSNAVTISPVSFRGIRLSALASAVTTDTIAFATKQLFV